MKEPLLPLVRICDMSRIQVRQTLPSAGDILVRVGQVVEVSQLLARCPTTEGGQLQVVDAAGRLGLIDEDMSQVMTKRRGDEVQAGETIAAWRGILPFLYRACRSPAAGRVEMVDRGWVTIKTDPEQLELTAAVAGQIISVEPGRSLTIETVGALIEGAVGLGGQAAGQLHLAVDDPATNLSPEDLDQSHEGKIVVAGAQLSPELLERGRQVRPAGLIVGSLSAAMCDRVRVWPFPVLVTEGFGQAPISGEAFALLKDLDGRPALLGAGMGRRWKALTADPRPGLSFRPAPSIGAGKQPGWRSEEQRPALVVPLLDGTVDLDLCQTAIPAGADRPAEIGDRVRRLRRPQLGAAGQIVAVPGGPARMASGLTVEEIRVSFPEHTISRATDGEAEDEALVPWLNLERIV